MLTARDFLMALSSLPTGGYRLVLVSDENLETRPPLAQLLAMGGIDLDEQMTHIDLESGRHVWLQRTPITG